MNLVVRSSRVVLPDGVRPAAIAASGGRVVSVAGLDASLSADREIDAGDCFVLPGLVDIHVHVNEPGRADWEGFETAGNAAAAGGTTTIVDMPLNSQPVTTTVTALEAKVAAAEGVCRVDFGLWGGIVPENADELSAMLEAGALGFKAFLVPSGIEEFQPVGDAELGRAMEIVAATGAPVLVHAEDAEALGQAEGALHASPSSCAAWVASRPAAAEAIAIARVAALAAKTGARAHVVHVSSAEGTEEIARAKTATIRISAETCPHYLSLAAEDAGQGDTRFKCAPPIREAHHKEALWRGLFAGTLDLVASDHSPCPPELKPAGDFARAWGGIAGLEVRLPVTWSEGRERGATVVDLVRWLADAPARVAGLSRKGRIAPGYDADFAILDPEHEWVVRGSGLHQRHCSTPWEGRSLRGAVRMTIVGGEVVYDRGAFVGAAAGRWLKRSGSSSDVTGAHSAV